MVNAPAAQPGLSDDRRDELIELLACRIERMGLTSPAILMLEAHKPLTFLGSQLLLVLQPILSIIVGGSTIDGSASREYVALLEDRANVEQLIRRLERQANSRVGTSA